MRLSARGKFSTFLCLLYYFFIFQVLKTRLALRKSGEMNRGIFNAFLTIQRNEGWRAFTRGYFPNLLGVSLSNFKTFYIVFHIFYFQIIPYAGTDLAVYEVKFSSISLIRSNN